MLEYFTCIVDNQFVLSIIGTDSVYLLGNLHRWVFPWTPRFNIRG